MSQSILQFLGLPDGFGYVLLVLALVLSLAPWLHGHDFGVLKIPDFDAVGRRVLKRAGPVALVAAIVLHLPLISVDPRPSSVQTEAQSADDAKPLRALPGSAQPQPLRVFADWQGTGCLYPADLMARGDRTATVRFDFDEQPTLPLDQIFTSGPPDLVAGARAFAKLLIHEDARVPVTIRATDSALVQVQRDKSGTCIPESYQPTEWIDKDDVFSVAPMGESQ